MIHTGIVRVGRDAELRLTGAGDPVLTVSLAYKYGKKDDQGNFQTTWVRASMFGKRAEGLAPHLTKGTQLCVTLTDLHMNEFQKKDGTYSAAIEARLDQIEFVGSREQSSTPAPQPQRQAPPPQRQPAASIEDMDSDIPF